MGYCELADIQKLMKWFEFSETSKVKASDITTYWIPEADSVIDSKLQRIYNTPITDSDDIEILQFISCRIVACEVANVLMLQADGEISDIVKRWCDMAKEKLQDILDRKILLPNSTLKDSGDRIYSFTAHGSDFLGEDAPTTPIWKIQTNQW